MLWVNVENPTSSDMDFLSTQFKCHALAIEDCLASVQRPKIDRYDNHLFIVMHAASLNVNNEEAGSRELDFFIGQRYLITVHMKPLNSISSCRRMCLSNPKIMEEGPSRLFYYLADMLVDNYFPILDILEKDIDDAESLMYKKQTSENVNRILQLKETVLTIRRFIGPQKELVISLTRGVYQPLISKKLTIYFRDIADLLASINDTLDCYRDVLTNVLDGYASVSSSRLNDIMRVLTIISTIMLPLTLISGIYGMNFKNMPELAWEHGYFLTLGIMLTISIGMLTYFKFKKWVIIIFLFFLVCSAFFSASETALLSMNKFRLTKIEQTDKKAAQRLFALLANPKRLFFSILTGNTLVNVALTSCLTAISVKLFQSNALYVAIPASLILLLLFGEIIPKTVAYLISETFAKNASYLLGFLIKVLRPLVNVLLFITNNVIARLAGIVPQDSAEISDDEIKSMIEIGYRQGVLEDDEREMIQGVFDFKDLKAADVMTPKPDIIGVDLESTKKDIFEHIRNAHQSRLPVYKENMDNVLGVLHTREVLLNPDKDIYSIMKPPYFVPESICIDQLLLNLQKKCIQMAIVVNEYGVTAGVVTIEDILEEIVGEIVDEYDDNQQKIEKIDENTYKINGLLNINEANDEFKLEIDTEEIDTMGGFVSLYLQKIPEKGEEFVYKNWRFRIIEIENRRIKEILMTRI